MKVVNDEKLVEKLEISDYLYAISELPESVRKKYFKENFAPKLVLDGMKLLTEYIDNYFNGEGNIEEIEKRIMNLPIDISYAEKEDMDALVKFCEKVYEFVLYEASMDEKYNVVMQLLSNKKINKIVYDGVKADIKANKEDLSLPPEFYDLINEADKKSLYLNIRLLKKIYEYKKGKLEGQNLTEENFAINRTKELKGKITVVNRRIKLMKLISKTLFSFPIVVVLSTPLPFNAAKSKAAENKNFITKAKINNEDMEQNINSRYLREISGIKSYIGKIKQDYIDTERRFVTVFSDTVDDNVNIRVYDYTDSALSDESLKNVALDESRLFLMQEINIKTYFGYELKPGDYIKDLGIYTGKSHIDISRVKYEFDSLVFWVQYVFLFTIAGALPATFGYCAHETSKEKQEELKKYIEEFIKLRKKIPKRNGTNTFKQDTKSTNKGTELVNSTSNEDFYENANEVLKMIQDYKEIEEDYSSVFKGIGEDGPFNEGPTNQPMHR